jgi:hypothetical protein
MRTFAPPWHRPFALPFGIEVGEPSSSTGPVYDPDASNWINARVASGDPLTDAKKLAVDTFIKAQKLSGVWAKIKRLYLFTAAGAGPANVIDMKTTLSGSFLGTVLHFNGYSQGNGSTGYFSMNTTPAALGLIAGSGGIGWLSIGGETGTAFAVMGAQNSGTQAIIGQWINSTGVRLFYCDSGAGLIAQGAAPATFAAGIVSAQRYSGTRYIMRRSGAGIETLVTNTSADSGPIPTVNIFGMAFNNNGSPNSYSTGKYGSFFVTNGLSPAETTAFTLDLKILWEALSGLTLSNLDANAEAFINAREAAGEVLNSTKKQAINTFVLGEKSAGRWASLKRLYLPIVASNPAANAVDLVTAIPGTFVGSVVHQAGSVRSTGGYFSMDVSPSTLGLTTAAGGLGWIGLGGETGLATVNPIGSQTSSIITATGTWNSAGTVRFNYNQNSSAGLLSTQTVGIAMMKGVVSMQRFGGLRYIKRRTDFELLELASNTSANSGTIPTVNFFALAQNNSGAPLGVTVGSYGAFFITLGWSKVNDDAFTLNLMNLWKTLTGLTLFPDDTQVDSFITSRTANGEVITTAKKNAITAFILGEKSAGRWASLARLYITTSGLQGADRVNVKTGIVDLNVAVPPTHSPGYVQGDGLSSYLIMPGFSGTGINPNEVTFSTFVLIYKPETRIAYDSGIIGYVDTTNSVAMMTSSGNTILSVFCDSVLRNYDDPLLTSNAYGVFFQSHIVGLGSDMVYRRDEVGFSAIVSHTTPNAGFFNVSAQYPVMATDIDAVVMNYSDAKFGAMGIGTTDTWTQATVEAFTQSLKTFWEGMSGLTLNTLDGDADLFIVAREAAGEVFTEPQKTAINNFVLAEKAAGRWVNIRRIYLPTSGIPAANAIDLKTRTSGTWMGSGITHGAGFVQSTGGAGHFDLGTSFDAEGLGLASAHLWMLQLTPNTGTAGAVGLDNSLSSQNDLRFTATDVIFSAGQVMRTQFQLQVIGLGSFLPQDSAEDGVFSNEKHPVQSL